MMQSYLSSALAVYLELMCSLRTSLLLHCQVCSAMTGSSSDCQAAGGVGHCGRAPGGALVQP